MKTTNGFFIKDKVLLTEPAFWLKNGHTLLKEILMKNAIIKLAKIVFRKKTHLSSQSMSRFDLFVTKLNHAFIGHINNPCTCISTCSVKENTHISKILLHFYFGYIVVFLKLWWISQKQNCAYQE